MLKTFPVPDKDREDRRAQVLLEIEREKERESRERKRGGRGGVKGGIGGDSTCFTIE